jgi:nitrate/TMAO reductase-like tetraheme cytochrome c subunit
MIRKLETKLSAALLLAVIVGLGGAGTAPAATDLRQDCIDCHEGATPAIVDQWQQSKHAKNNIGCYACHHADSAAADRIEHNGTGISVLVSARRCGQCHMDVVS